MFRVTAVMFASRRCFRRYPGRLTGHASVKVDFGSNLYFVSHPDDARQALGKHSQMIVETATYESGAATVNSQVVTVRRRAPTPP